MEPMLTTDNINKITRENIMQKVTPEELYEWCKIPVEKLAKNPLTKIPFRLC